MRARRRSAGLVVVSVAISALLVTAIGVRAQRGAGAGPAAKPPVPVAASSLLLHPELYVGQTVSVMGVAEGALSKTAFALDQGKSQKGGGAVLVIAPTLNGELPLHTYISVVGDAVKFDPAEVTKRFKDYTLDLAPELVEKFRGQPAVIATAVITESLTDIAKKPIRPPTPEEDALDKVMKTVSTTFATLRQNVDASSAADVKARTADLRKSFLDTAAFFSSRSTADAVGWAKDAGKFVDTIDAAAAAGKWDDAKAAVTSLNGVCGQCHNAHRERQDDGTYRVKG